MINIETFAFNSFQENTYLLYDHSGECIIVDAGCEDEAEREQLTAYIEEHGFRPVKLVNTHCHVDHILGVAYLAEKYKIPFFIHPEEKVLFTHSRSQADFFGLKLDTPPEPEDYLVDGDVLEFGESALKIIHVPGHSPGGILLHCPEQKFLISGDVLFLQSIGRTDLPGGDYNSLVGGIIEKLLILDPDTRVYPGHGPPTTIGEEKASNPFLA
jgi:glyoxylase-like metal-dependent hydrolase (beta-lactamase superfamily II)